MANPQKEHGYTPIAHELLEALIRAKLTGQQWSALMVIMRHSYGMSKKETTLSYNQIAKFMKVERRQARKIIKSLVGCRMALPASGVLQDTTGRNCYRIQKDYHQWVGPYKAPGVLHTPTPGVLQHHIHQEVVISSNHKQPAPEVRLLIGSYYDHLTAVLGEKPVNFSGGALGRLFKQAIKTQKLEEIKQRIDNWFKSTDKFIVSNGFKETLFISNYNNLRSGPMNGTFKAKEVSDAGTFS